ncbi:hypothetical protein HF326_13165 [Bacillus altitudinis MN12]|uniref:hypothetical protein n=1 Tax=Bacillus altitudinis TaxID=293387 RepID=UPI001B83A2F2|nr:hypothetical protein [Bacillus altitudinis]MCA1014037.1 hypothetical protein [Bacillus stratosphericus]MBR0584001.1 hypothetical protein [Bacillus altitudinis MN12]MBR0594134.1 hypothetical protein [Bacillus altitudinis C16B11]MBR0611105.1 hypothetical protein [Bacillus altitudinis]MCA2385329.1 hypothetical protein [Bacillus stratosphericus]
MKKFFHVTNKTIAEANRIFGISKKNAANVLIGRAHQAVKVYTFDSTNRSEAVYDHYPTNTRLIIATNGAIIGVYEIGKLPGSNRSACELMRSTILRGLKEEYHRLYSQWMDVEVTFAQMSLEIAMTKRGQIGEKDSALLVEYAKKLSDLCFENSKRHKERSKLHRELIELERAFVPYL